MRSSEKKLEEKKVQEGEKEIEDGVVWQNLGDGKTMCTGIGRAPRQLIFAPQIRP